MRIFFIFCQRVMRKLWWWWCVLIAAPCTFCLLLLFPFYKIRLIALFSDRIGHYALNTELFLCHLNERKLLDNGVKYIFYTRVAPICNSQLHRMWKRKIVILPFCRVLGFTDRWMNAVLGKHYKPKSLRTFHGACGPDVDGHLFKYAPHLDFCKQEHAHANAQLAQLGIPKGAKYVCIVARDSAYLNAKFPGKDWSYHNIRDCDIDNFSKAALFLAQKGYYVIRMGKTVEKPFGIFHERIIDYATQPLRSDFLDIYLLANCTFCISSSLGLDAVPQIFRRPIALVNVAPLNNQLASWYPHLFFITKKIFDNKKNRFLSLKEIGETMQGLGGWYTEKNGPLEWRFAENTPEELLQITIQMEETVRLHDRQDSNLFHSILLKHEAFARCFVQGYDVIGTAIEKFYIQIGQQFFSDNRFLFS